MTPKPFSVVLNSVSVGKQSKDNRNARPSTRTASTGANSGNLRNFDPERDSDNFPHLNRFALLAFGLFALAVVNLDKWFQDGKRWLNSHLLINGRYLHSKPRSGQHTTAAKGTLTALLHWLLYRRECLCGECMEGFCMAPNVEDGKCGRCQK